MSNHIIEIYTDGSCNPKFKIGGWASIILHNTQKYVLQGCSTETTHNRMELTAIVNSIEYSFNQFSDFKQIKIYTDSQYVAEIPNRQEKLRSKRFKTNYGNQIQNTDLVTKLILLINSSNIELIKVKAHQKTSVIPNFNREVDKLSRKLVRQQISDNGNFV